GFKRIHGSATAYSLRRSVIPALLRERRRRELERLRGRDGKGCREEPACRSRVRRDQLQDRRARHPEWKVPRVLRLQRNAGTRARDRLRWPVVYLGFRR